MNWQLITFLLLLSPLWGWFNVWLIRSFYEAGQGDPYTKEWHLLQGCMKALIFAYSCCVNWQVALVWAAYDYIIYPGIINLYALKQWEKRSFFYVGKKGRKDQHPDLLQDWFLSMAYPERNNAVFKFSFLGLCVFVYPIWKGMVFLVNWICDLILSIF